MIILTPDSRYSFRGRDGSPTDATVVRETWSENVYQIHASDFDDTGVLIDLGANIGSVSVYAASLGEHVRVHAYEPEPENLALLTDNLTANGVADRVQIYPYVVTDWRGTAQIDPRHGNTRVVEYDEGVTVPCVELAEVLEAVGACDVLKIDIEGSEYDIFADVDLSVLQRVRYLTMEFDAEPEPGAFGRMITPIAEVFNTHVIGAPSRGGYIYGRRY